MNDLIGPEKQKTLEKFSDESGLINLDDLTKSFYAKLVGEEMAKDKKSPAMVAAITELYKVISN